MGEALQGGVLPLAGDIIAASAALAGFILVYLNALASGYAAYPKPDRKSVISSFRTRAWLAFAGIVFAVGAGATGAIAKWQASPEIAGISLCLFAATLFWSILAAAFIASEIE